jgi:hypothetical protein
MQAGLGGGSGNAATAMHAFNSLCDYPASKEQLLVGFIVIELHKRRLFIYIPYAKYQIWTFNFVYIYADWYFY